MYSRAGSYDFVDLIMSNQKQYLEFIDIIYGEVLSARFGEVPRDSCCVTAVSHRYRMNLQYCK